MSWTSSSWVEGGERGCSGAGLAESIAWATVSAAVGVGRETWEALTSLVTNHPLQSNRKQDDFKSCPRTVALERAMHVGGVGMGNVFS